MEETLLRIIIVGDSSVGKTCLVVKFTEDRFIDAHDITIGVELGNKVLQLENNIIKFQIWDTSGQENYRSVTRSFYRRAGCAILVFDLTDSSSFYNCESWVREIRQNSKDDIVLYLVGNKSDLVTGDNIPIDEINKFVASHGILAYKQTSAKTGENIENVFREAAVRLLEMDKGTNPKDSGKFEIQKVNQVKSKRKRCC